VEFVTEFLQFTSLKPSIYRLTEILNLDKFGLWLSSVRKNSAILSITSIRPDGLAERPNGLRYNSFPHSNGTLEYSENAGQRPDGVALSSTQSARHCGASRRLHKNRFFCLGICKESSWTSSRNL
jgi:hypothetical protein